MSNLDIDAIVETAQQAVEPHIIAGPDGEPAFAIHNLPATQVSVTDLEELLAPHRARPRRKTGTFQAHTPQAFADYYAKHATWETEVWADQLASKVTAVLNAHGFAAGTPGPRVEQDRAVDDSPYGNAGWGDHRLTYEVHLTDAWKAWMAADGKLMPQVEFANLVEERAIDVIQPQAADMLELVQTFHARTDVEFQSSQRLSSGEVRFVYKEDVQATAGQNGTMEVPTEFTLLLQPFEGAEPQEITARFRYRIVQKHLHMGFQLERPKDVIREAFNSVVDQIGTLLGEDTTILAGTPA